jgi:predicted TIM-barrel fold metal-dependent hydrolase
MVMLASLAADAGYDKLLFASGWSVTRPSALIEAFRALDLSAELSAGYRLPPLDARAKAAILGDTAARLLELSPS